MMGMTVLGLQDFIIETEYGMGIFSIGDVTSKLTRRLLGSIVRLDIK